jgi:hypothetical protein
MHQLAQLDESLKAIRDQFRHGGSPGGILLTALVILGILLLAYVLTKRQQRTAQPARKADPEGLFFSMLEKLPLTAVHRRMLTSFVADLNIEQPTVILLSRQTLRRSAQRWRERHRAHEGDDRNLELLLHEVEAILFPSEPDGGAGSAGGSPGPASGPSSEPSPARTSD